jgi:hypothetical protein
MREKLKTLVVVLLSLLVVGFFLSIYIVVDEEIPGNAIIIVTEEDKLYHSIHFDHICVSGKTARTMPLSEAIAKGYKPDEHCQALGYFKGNSHFLFHHILSKFGLRVNSRWDEKGNWRW